LIIPNLFQDTRWNIAKNANRVFENRIASTPLPKQPYIWSEPTFNYTTIPYHKHIQLLGYFQSEKYFRHRREEILQLFTSPTEIMENIKHKYPFLFTDELVVGIQIRDYRVEPQYATGEYHPTHKRNYYEKAIRYFPQNTIYIVSTNNPDLAKECMDGLSKNIIYLNSGDYIEEFYALTLCKSFIISNSSFGWWAAWLSTSDYKIILVPRPWYSLPYDDNTYCKDLIPEDWVIVPVRPD